MGRIREVHTAAGQASLLFVAAGSLGLVSGSVPSDATDSSLWPVNVSTILLGLLISRLPWDRWKPRSTLALVPAAFALLVFAQWLDAAAVGSLYALWFVVVFCWVGSWHPARTSLYLAPVAAIAYTIPFLPGSPAHSPESLATVVIAIPIAVILAEVLAAKSAAMRKAHAALEEASLLLERANVTDDLTGLGNRRRANTLLDGMRPGDAVVLLDLDHFKTVNDTRGHAEGDRVLMRLGEYLLEAVRDADCVARFGGEEFLIVLRGAGRDADAIVERLLTGWRECGGGVTLSAGAAIHMEGSGPDATLKRADALLYQAKADGRDRLVMENGELSEISLDDELSPARRDLAG